MKKKILIFSSILAAVLTIILLSSGISKESRYDGGGNDLVQELYDQAVKQNEQLQDLQESISKFYKKKMRRLKSTTALPAIIAVITVMPARRWNKSLIRSAKRKH